MSDNRRIRKSTFVLVGAAVLAAALAFKLLGDTRAEREARRNAITDFSTARHDDALLDETVLRSRSFLSDDYDGLVRAGRELSSFCGETGAARGVFGVDRWPELAPDGARFCEAVAAKLDAVERFKSANSVFKNAIRYLPELVGRAPDLRRREHASAALSRLLQYAADPVNPEIRAEFETFVARSARRGEGLEREIALHLRSGAAALERRDAAERIIFRRQVPDALADLQSKYLRLEAESGRRASRSRTFLVLACACLGFVTVGAFVKIYRDSRLLADLNRNLESKVRARTDELTETLERLRSSQEMVAQSAKMSALGEMSGGIAHEINTPLAAIGLLTEQIGELVMEDPFDRATVAKMTATIASTVGRISAIIKGVRTFSRDGGQDPFVPAGLRQIVEETLSICGEKLRQGNVALEVAPIGEDLRIRCRAVQISQVLLNLVSNACDAIRDLPEKRIRIAVEARENVVRISVTDSGPGIPESVRAKLFQPFFTTKEPGKGTGLGLSISRGIAAAHGGSLDCLAEAPNTTFVLSLPGAVAPTAAAA